MEKRLEMIERAVYEMRDEMKVLAVNSATQNEQLKEHMRRTALVEEQNNLLKDIIQQNDTKLDNRFTPLETFVDRAKFLGAVAAVAGSLVMAAHKLGFLSFT